MLQGPEIDSNLKGEFVICRRYKNPNDGGVIPGSVASIAIRALLLQYNSYKA
jgi:hypothetical protein